MLDRGAQDKSSAALRRRPYLNLGDMQFFYYGKSLKKKKKRGDEKKNQLLRKYQIYEDSQDIGTHETEEYTIPLMISVQHAGDQKRHPERTDAKDQD